MITRNIQNVKLMRAEFFVLQKLLLEKLMITKEQISRGDVHWRKQHRLIDHYLTENQTRFKKNFKDSQKGFTPIDLDKNFGHNWAFFLSEGKVCKEAKRKNITFDDCTVSESTFKRFLKRENFTTTKKIIDISVYDAFSLFLDCNGYGDFEKRYFNEIKQVEKDFQQSQDSATRKGTVQENLDFIPHYEPSNWFYWLFRRIKLLFGKDRWLYDFENNNAPLALSWEYLRNQAKDYISTDFQLDTTSEDANKETKEDILGYLYKQLFKRKGRLNKFIFILSGSGTGKTSLLLNLYLKARKYNVSKRVFILPFSQRQELNELKGNFQNDILLLDGLDEDFQIRKIDRQSHAIADEIFEQTKKFGHVIISSRNQFFRENSVISDFIEKVTIGNESYNYQTLFLCSFTDAQVTEFLKRKYNGQKLKKAFEVVDYIGKERLHRQLLIANIDRLFPVLDNPNQIPEARTFYLFDALMKNWNTIEKGKVRSKINTFNDRRVKVFEQTFSFCKMLAKCFIEQKRDFSEGFSFEEIQFQLSNYNFEKGKILTNRTFLILDINDRYRFPHQSIYEFFLTEYLYDKYQGHFCTYLKTHGSSFPFHENCWKKNYTLNMTT